MMTIDKRRSRAGLELDGHRVECAADCAGVLEWRSCVGPPCTERRLPQRSQLEWNAHAISGLGGFSVDDPAAQDAARAGQERLARPALVLANVEDFHCAVTRSDLEQERWRTPHHEPLAILDATDLLSRAVRTTCEPGSGIGQTCIELPAERSVARRHTTERARPLGGTGRRPRLRCIPALSDIGRWSCPGWLPRLGRRSGRRSCCGPLGRDCACDGSGSRLHAQRGDDRCGTAIHEIDEPDHHGPDGGPLHGSPHSGAPIVSAKSSNIRLKLTLIRGRSLRFAETECGSQAGKRSSAPISTGTTTWSVL